MRHGVANICAEREEENTADDVEGRTEDDVAEDPTIVQGADDENELRDDVNDNADGGEDQVGNEEADGFVEAKNGDILKCRDGDEEADAPNDEAR